MGTTAKVAIAIALLVLLAWGGDVIYTKAQVAAALRSAFEAQGLPPEWGEALGRQESSLNMKAIVNTGGDALYGGSYGATQITQKTARGYGYTGPMENLLTDLNLMASLSAKIAAAGQPMSIEDLGAWWNDGVRTFDALPETKTIKHADGTTETIPHPTRYTYVPHLVSILENIS
jgi:hypothetical protein